MEAEAPVREKSPVELADKSFAQHEESVIDEAFGFIDEWSETLSNAEVQELNASNGGNNAAFSNEATSAKLRRVSVVEQEQSKSRKTWEKKRVQRSVSVFHAEHPKFADSGSKSQSCKVLSHARSLPGINNIQEDVVQNNGRSEKEVKKIKEWLQFEKELAVRSALQNQESQWQKQRQSSLTRLSLETERLQVRVRRLSEEKALLESTLLKKSLEERTLKRDVQLIKRDAERYVNRLAQNAHRQEVREQQEIRKLEQSLKAKEEIIKEKERIIAKLEAEKLYLGEEIYRLTGVEEAFWSDETLQAPAVTTRERGLLRRASELSLHANKLEKKCAILSGENEVLKRKMELEQEKERPLREREKDKDRERERERERQRELGTLKKKNQELALQTKKLEEKVKSLEKKSKESPVLNSFKNVEQPQQQRRVVQTYPQTFKWREKEAELQQLQKQLNERDREIGRLKEKLRELTKSLKEYGSSTKLGNEVATLEVESVLKLVSKEKLQLERHLMLASQGVQRHAELEAGRYAELEATNQQLRQQLEQLECLCREQSEAAAQLSRRQVDREQQLAERLHQQQQLCNDLESQLSRVIDKNAEVTIENSDLKKQILELKQAESECATLRASLTAAQSECIAAQAEVSSLREKMAGLENVLRQMRDAADRKRELERQHAEALAQLRDQQAQLALLSKASESEKAQAAVLIENLQSKVREFDRKAELQNVRHDELMLEMAALKKSQSQSLSQSSLNHSGTSALDNGYAPGSGLNKSRYAGIDLDSRTSSPDSLRFVSNGNISRATPLPGQIASDPMFDDLRTGSFSSSSRLSSSKVDSSTAHYLDGLLIDSELLNLILDSKLDQSARHEPSSRLRTSPSLPSLSPVHTDSLVPHLAITNPEGETRFSQLPSHALATSSTPASLTTAAAVSATPSVRTFPSGALSRRGLAASTSALVSGHGVSVGVATPSHHSIVHDSSFNPSLLAHKGESRSTGEIDRIMAKIEQDNRVLAELDKSRATVGGSSKSVTFADDDSVLVCGNHLRRGSRTRWSDGARTPSGARYFRSSAPSPPLSPAAYLSVPPMTYGLGTDMRRTRNTTTSTALGVDSGYLSQSSASQSLSPILTSSSAIVTTHPLPQVTLAHAIPTSQFASAAFSPLNLNLVNTVNPIMTQMNSIPGLNGMNSLANHPNSLAYSTFTMVGPTVTNPPLALPNIPVEMNGPSFYHANETESKADMLDIPGKGRCYVYIARYSYDPFTQSPNENPEAELPLHAGDYVLIWGTMDEDGFYDGELLDGRRGLVPSNLVQRLVGEDLLEFHRAAVLGLQLADDSVSTALPREVLTLNQPSVNPEETNGHAHLDAGFSQVAFHAGRKQLQQGRTWDYEAARRAMDMGLMDLQDFLEDEEIALGVRGEGPVPPPKQLTLERQLNKSIVIGWNPPDASQGTIDCYHVYVDGVLKTTVRASERTRALIEGVDSGKVHRISVRSVTPRRRASLDAACTMVIGKDAPLAPTCVKASHITATSAIISWLPSNSNFQHTVCVNSVEVRTLKPGVFRHTISGLSPNTVYRVSVRAKNIRSPHYDAAAAAQLLNDQEKYATHVEFRTLPKGVPDPPVDVQVEAGPQDGTLLVTWLPVTISSTAGTSNGVPVTGYAVYADGKKVTDVDTPTGDHALLDIGSLLGLEAKALTVRTKARDTQSADSIPAPIPSNVIRNTKRGPLTKNAVNESVSESITLDLVKQIHENLARESLWTYSYPLLKEPNDSDERPSELSDIAEEPEDVSLSDQEALETINERERRRAPQDHGYSARGYDEEDEYRGNYREYPPNQVIPSIEITKDSASERSVERYPPMDYDRRGAPRGRVREPPSVRDRSLPPSHRGDRQRYGNDPYYDRETKGRVGPGPGPGPGPTQGPPRRPPPVRSETRIFVALFDYDPPTMSPNPDACEEELPFREGQLIKIRGDKDTDGFYWGEAGGKCGYVPCNMVSEVQVDDERVAEELLKESGENGPPAHHGYSHPRGKGGRRGLPPRGAHSRDRWGDIYANMPVKKMLALYDYDPQELSPNVDSEVELSFQTGDVIYVYGDMDDDGFYMGELRGVRGLVPSNFLTEAPPDNDAARRTRALDDRDRSMGRDRERERERLSGADGPPPPPRGNLRMERRKDNRNSPVDRRLPYDHERLGPREEDPLGPTRRDGSRPRLQADESFSDLEDRRSMHNPNVDKPNANGPVPVTNNNGSPGQNILKRGPVKGLPSVFPDLSLIGQNNASGTGPNVQSATNAKTGPPPANSTIASASVAITNPVEGLFTKGKDLIFKKFGLGE